MITTLDIEDDILNAVEEIAHREGKSVGQVMSDLARKGLEIRARSSDEISLDYGDEFAGFRPIGANGTAVTSEMINRIREEEGI